MLQSGTGKCGDIRPRVCVVSRTVAMERWERVRVELRLELVVSERVLPTRNIYKTGGRTENARSNCVFICLDFLNIFHCVSHSGTSLAALRRIR